MKNKCIIAAATLFAALAVSGSIAVYAVGNETQDKSTYSYSGQENGSSYADTDETENNDATNNTDYSFSKGQSNAQSRNSIYQQLPVGGTKEDAQAFYEQNDVGGGAWTNGEYDESAKTDYGYMAGQQKGSSYTQETDGTDTPDKSDYNYCIGRQSYEENHESWRK